MENEKVISEYLLGNLNEDQKKKFENRLESDQDFFQEYTLLKHMHAYLSERKSRDIYGAEIERLGDKYFPTKGKQSSIFLKKALAYGIIAIIALLSIWYLLTPSENDLYESHADHFALHLVLKSDKNTIALNAENTFNKGEFDLAIVELKKYLDDNEIDTKARLALGISYLETGKNEEAFVIFDEIGNGSSTLKEYAIWYKALYHVKKSEYEKAKSILKLISEMDIKLHNKANKLEKDIDALVKK